MFARILAAGVAGAVAMFLLGWVIYGMLLKGYFDSTMTQTAKSMMADPPNFPPLIVAQIVFGLLFAFIFAYWASVRTFAGGLAAGAILMFLAFFAFNLGGVRGRLLHDGAIRVSSAQIKTRRSVAVLGFKNLSGRADENPADAVEVPLQRGQPLSVQLG